MPKRSPITVIDFNLSIHHSTNPVHLTPQCTSQVPSTENNGHLVERRENIKGKSKYGICNAASTWDI